MGRTLSHRERSQSCSGRWGSHIAGKQSLLCFWYQVSVVFGKSLNPLLPVSPRATPDNVSIGISWSLHAKQWNIGGTQHSITWILLLEITIFFESQKPWSDTFYLWNTLQVGIRLPNTLEASSTSHCKHMVQGGSPSLLLIFSCFSHCQCLSFVCLPLHHSPWPVHCSHTTLALGWLKSRSNISLWDCQHLMPIWCFVQFSLVPHFNDLYLCLPPLLVSYDLCLSEFDWQ